MTTRIAVFAAALIFWLSPAALHAQAVTSSVQVPLAGTVFVPLSDGSFDGVSLSGFAHVFVYVRTPSPLSPTDPYRIQINLDSVSGVGDVTGFRYEGMGAFRINLPTAPVDPINVSFDLLVAGVPPNPIAPTDPFVPLDISFVLNFDPFGDTLTKQCPYPVDIRARALAQSPFVALGELVAGWVEAHRADTHRCLPRAGKNGGLITHPTEVPKNYRRVGGGDFLPIPTIRNGGFTTHPTRGIFVDNRTMG